MSASESRAAASAGRSSQLLRGMRLGLPIFLGYLPVGLAFGVVASAAGFSVSQAVACSALALAGAGQFIGVSLVEAGAGLPAIVLTNAIVNLRYLLFGATVAPHLRGAPPWRHAILAHTLTDETFAVNIVDLKEGRATPDSMTGVGLVSWTAWVAATLVGAMATSAIGDPSTWGIDYAMPAMFTALLVGQIEERAHLYTAILAAALTLVSAWLLPGSWFLVVASILAATVGALLFR
jgi:4-azaleucine resistance transporter AzlC